jgi:hypothetical protein
MLFADKPTLFLAYASGWFEDPFLAYLEGRLKRRDVLLYGLARDRRVGEVWTRAAAERMLAADGILAVWTHGGAKASGVVAEVNFALDQELELCLLREPMVKPPAKWPDEKLWTLLRGVDGLFSLNYNIFSKWTCVDTGPMDDLVDEITTFAWRAKVKRAASQTP